MTHIYCLCATTMAALNFKERHLGDMLSLGDLENSRSIDNPSKKKLVHQVSLKKVRKEEDIPEE